MNREVQYIPLTEGWEEWVDGEYVVTEDGRIVETGDLDFVSEDIEDDDHPDMAFILAPFNEGQARIVLGTLFGVSPDAVCVTYTSYAKGG